MRKTGFENRRTGEVKKKFFLKAKQYEVSSQNDEKILMISLSAF